MHCARTLYTFTSPTPISHVGVQRRRWPCSYTSTLVLNQSPSSTDQCRSCSASQWTSSMIINPASTATKQRQYQVATTRSQRPPSRPLTRRTEHQLVNDDEAEDASGGNSDDHRRHYPRINSNGHQRLLRTRIISKIRRGKYTDFEYLLPAVDDIVPVQAAQPPAAKLSQIHGLPNLDGGMEQLPYHRHTSHTLP